MQPSKQNSLSTATSLVLIALMATSCSRAVEIPREQIDDPVYKEPGSYRIRLDGREDRASHCRCHGRLEHRVSKLARWLFLRCDSS